MRTKQRPEHVIADENVNRAVIFERGIPASLFHQDCKEKHIIMNWHDKANEMLDKINKHREDNDGWKQSKKAKDVVVWWKPSSDWDGALYKAESFMEADPETVFSYIDPTPDGPRSKWDKAIKELHTVEKVDQEVSIVKTVTHSAFGGLISSRDFIDLVFNVKNDDYLATHGEGVEHPGSPPTSDHVRGHNHPCAIVCYKIPENPNRTKVASYIQTDLGGMLPKSLVENALPSNMVDFFTALKNVLKEDGHWKETANGNS